MNKLVEEGRNNLENLWAGHLIERGLYDKATFIITAENVRPNLHREMVQHHMDNGLRKYMNQVIERKTSIQQNRLLKEGVFAINSLLGGSSKKNKETYNGFKDELTDWSKYKGQGVRLFI
ncbi:hypothetical protein [Euzebyella saccharophila]|uniref:Uncharacterized protein n=1 Tax=Euzebyella saccharophila TaxID=679664 RepID=A0ABV8JQQ3_9FLAO|nr:hypothetical protein [Euzebyella saccharophila]